MAAAYVESQSDDVHVSESATTLTAFERRTLELFASGVGRGEIARLQNRAPKTISNSLTAAKDKLGARSLAEAAALVAAEAAALNLKFSV